MALHSRLPVTRRRKRVACLVHTLQYESSVMSGPTAVDLFSGAGGASLGLAGAGFDLRLAADFDPACGLTHAANLPGEFITGDIREVEADKVATTAGIAPGELDLLFAGPPCQGFSMIGARVVWDARNNLFREALRLAGELRPQCVVIENVPGLVTLAGGAYLRAILQGLDEAGYTAACAELLAAQYGAPQMRWRLIIIGWRRDLGIDGGYGFPVPTAGSGSIGDLLPNCTITAVETSGFTTTREGVGEHRRPVAAPVAVPRGGGLVVLRAQPGGLGGCPGINGPRRDAAGAVLRLRRAQAYRLAGRRGHRPGQAADHPRSQDRTCPACSPGGNTG